MTSQVSFVGNLSSSIMYLEGELSMISASGCSTEMAASGIRDIEDTCLPRIYTPPLTADVRQKPCAISPNPP